MKNKFLKNQQAFTMIELLVSATIIILLTVAGLISYRQAGYSSRNSKRKADLETVRQAMMIYKQNNGYYYPNTTVDFGDIVSILQTDEYLSDTVVVDPKEDGVYVYTATCERTENGNCMKVQLGAKLEPNEEDYSVSTF